MQTKFDTLFAYLKKHNIVAPFARLTTRTEPKLLAAARAVYPLGVQRTSVRVGQVGMVYENCIKNATGDEDFQVQSLWRGKGVHVDGNRYLVKHVDKDDLYIAFRARENKDGSLMIPEDVWIDIATKEVIGKPIDFLPKSSESPYNVIWRTINIKNILKVECGAIFDYS